MRYQNFIHPFICHYSFRGNPLLKNVTIQSPPAAEPPPSPSGLLVFVLWLVMNLIF